MNSVRKDSDEQYVIDLIEEIHKEKALRQHRFEWLRGDTGVRLPVDAYFPQNQLVVEYREHQHLYERPDSFKLWDKKPTASGINRRQQRTKYDKLREQLIPSHGLRLVPISPSDLVATKKGRLIRQPRRDVVRLTALLLEAIPRYEH